jgi:predicted deacetylase
LSSKFLLRFDDICPTINWGAWEKLEKIMLEEDVRPILSVIPDNQDEALHEGEPNVHFWERVRGWQAHGWTIGLHGYQHRYVTAEAGMIGLNNFSEFSGLPFEEQRDKLQKGLAIFQREKVRADVWVAPAHSFDANTVRALVSLGVRTISDGMALYPHRDSQGVFWVPQQLWRFRTAPFGVWTVCVHQKDDLYLDAALFQRRIREYRRSITSFPEVVQAYAQRKRSSTDDIFAALWSFAIQVKAKLAEPAAYENPVTAAQIEPEPGPRPGLNAVR